MSHNRNNQAVSVPGTWLCPHCFRREPYPRYLVSTDERIPLWEDRKQYWHRFALGERQDSHQTTNRLTDGRLAWDPDTRQPGVESLPSLRGCVHCHMSSDARWAGTEVYQVIAGSPAAYNALQQLIRRHGDTAQWSALPSSGIARRYGLCLEERRWEFAVCLHPAGQTESGYRRELMDRLSREAAGYLLILDLEQRESEVTICRELNRLVRLHAAQLPLKQRAGIVLLLPEAESLHKHGRIRRQLGQMFPDAELRIITAFEELNDTLPQAVRQLLGLNVPETEEPVRENTINADVSG